MYFIDQIPFGFCFFFFAFSHRTHYINTHNSIDNIIDNNTETVFLLRQCAIIYSNMYRLAALTLFPVARRASLLHWSIFIYHRRWRWACCMVFLMARHQQLDGIGVDAVFDCTVLYTVCNTYENLPPYSNHIHNWIGFLAIKVLL